MSKIFEKTYNLGNCGHHRERDIRFKLDAIVRNEGTKPDDSCIFKGWIILVEEQDPEWGFGGLKAKLIKQVKGVQRSVYWTWDTGEAPVLKPADEDKATRCSCGATI